MKGYIKNGANLDAQDHVTIYGRSYLDTHGIVESWNKRRALADCSHLRFGIDVDFQRTHGDLTNITTMDGY